MIGECFDCIDELKFHVSATISEHSCRKCGEQALSVMWKKEREKAEKYFCFERPNNKQWETFCSSFRRTQLFHSLMKILRALHIIGNGYSVEKWNK